MADYRTIQSKIYRDDWFSRQEVDAKFLFIYLFTNPSATVAGIYEMPVRFASVDTGIGEERVRAILEGFEDDGKIEWCEPFIWIKKMREYQASNSPALKTRIQRDLSAIPDSDLKRHHAAYYGDPVGTMPTPCTDGVKNSKDPISGQKDRPLNDTIRHYTDDTKQHTGADAPASGSGNKNSSSVKPLDEYHATTQALEDEFSRLTGLPKPLHETKKQQTDAATRWWNPLMAIWQIADKDTLKAKSLMEKAIAHMSSENLTFDAPISIVTVCRSQSKTVTVSSNGTSNSYKRPGKQTSADYERRWAEHAAQRKAKT